MNKYKKGEKYFCKNTQIVFDISDLLHGTEHEITTDDIARLTLTQETHGIMMSNIARISQNIELEKGEIYEVVAVEYIEGYNRSKDIWVEVLKYIELLNRNTGEVTATDTINDGVLERIKE